MLTTFVLVIGLMTILAVLLLVIVVIGIRQEPPSEELNEQALSLIALFVRCLLGLYVRKPHSSPNVDQGDKANATLRAGPRAASVRSAVRSWRRPGRSRLRLAQARRPGAS